MNEEPNSSQSGRILALDLGDRRIGVALSDPTRMIAKPLLVIKRKSRFEDFSRLKEVVNSHSVEHLVIGLPVNLSGHEGQRAVWTRDYAVALSAFLQMEAELWDESFSTKDAEDSLRLRGISPRSQRSRIDAIAAALILQSYLDSHQKAIT
jgi:putative Holliday junction resolvase